MYNPFAKIKHLTGTDTFAQKSAAVSHQIWMDAAANTITASGLAGAGLGAGIGALNGAVSYDGTFFGGAVNGAMLGGIGGLGVKGFASVYSSGVRRATDPISKVGPKDFKWSTFSDGLGFNNRTP